ncbi:SCO family protein [Aurantiacibacter spongiae]|nr:SCO family protein [Aurantiacibacter spongiae]
MSSSIKAVPAILALLLGLSSCGSEPPPEGVLEGSALTGQFSLVDENGQAVTQNSYDGKYRMVYFGYAYCPNICPFDTQRMMQGYRTFADAHPDLAERVQPLFVTIDPERDTPAVLREYTANFGDELIGLTGSQEQVDRAAEAFSVFHSRGETTESGGYLMDHSNAGYLMGPRGEPITLLPVDESGQAVADELETYVR